MKNGWKLRSLDFEVAARAALAMAIPLLVLGLVGRFDLTAYATFGSMAALYGRNQRYRMRLRTVSIGAIGLVSCIGLGTLLALAGAPLLLVTASLLVVITLAILLAAVAALSPATPLFFVFALLVCTYLPTPAGEVGLRMLLAVASAALAWLITMAGWVVRRAAGQRADTLFKDLTPQRPWRPEMLRAGPVWLVIAQSLLGVLIVGAIALSVGLGHPYWAVVSVLAVIPQPGARHSISRAIHRVIGTTIGVMVTGLILWPQPPAFVLVTVVVVALFCGEILIARHYGAALVFITPLALSTIHLASPLPVSVLLVDRLVETALGAAVGMVLVLLARYRFGEGTAPATSG